MIGYITADGQGVSDRIMIDVAARLSALGLRLAGAVQHNLETVAGHRCHMELHLLGCGQVVRISQELGPHATACRLDAGAFAQAVGLAERDLAQGADVLIVNKFAQQEADGRGWRPVIAAAVVNALPVLIAVKTEALPAFLTFAGGMAQELPSDASMMCDWALAQRPHA